LLRRPGFTVVVITIAYAAVISLASAFAIEEVIPGYCDENLRPGTRAYEGCEFLEDGGYAALRVVPLVVLFAFALAAYWRRRVRFVNIGFALALLLIGVTIATEPSEYPWADGSSR
jgi:hypothetical protein